MTAHTFTWTATDAQWSRMKHVFWLSRDHLRQAGGTSKLRKKGTTYTLRLEGPGSGSAARTIGKVVGAHKQLTEMRGSLDNISSVLEDIKRGVAR